MDLVPVRRRRARPVADAPLDALLPHADVLAKGWLLGLLEQAPLHESPSILTEPLTRDGPRVCDAVLRALADDDDLRRLEPAGALRSLAARTGTLAGASGPVAVSAAVDVLQGVLWAALIDELRRPDGDLVAPLAERLNLVCEVIRGAALAQDGSPEGGRPRELAAVPRDAGRRPARPGAGGDGITGDGTDDRFGPPGGPQHRRPPAARHRLRGRSHRAGARCSRPRAVAERAA